MTKTQFSHCLFIFALVMSSCSSKTAQPSVAQTPTTPPDEYPFFPTAIPTNSTTIPITWAHLNLNGRLVYALGAVDDANNYVIQIQILDLVTGKVATIYKAPSGSWIYYVSVSPDGERLIMSYSPPPSENPGIIQALYTLPLDGSQPPDLLFMPPTPEDQYTQAEWSPDGKYIYYTHVNHQIPDDPNRVSPLYTIFRMAYPGGQPERIATGAYWPRLSSDSARLVYVSVDPFSSEHELRIADADGENAQKVMLSGSYIPEDKDAPIFSPDGESIIFSGEVPGESYQPNWFGKLFGIRVARANGESSDWWSVPINGGALTRLTNIRHGGLYASISPDNQYLASFSRDNIFVMRLDGSDLTVLISGLNGFSGTVHWIP